MSPDQSLRLTILGSCSGTEPMPERHHTSIAIEYAGRTYWFDAGENCAHTSYTNGIDMLGAEAIFISHTHIDHTGGLPNLLWTFGKLARAYADARERLEGREIKVFMPDLGPWTGAMRLLEADGDEYPGNLNVTPHTFDDGVVYDNHGVRVTALHNAHRGTGIPHRSFSFRMDVRGEPRGGRAIVFSGDVKHVSEVEPLLDGGADVFLMETGHHKVDEVCTWLRDSGLSVGRLVFTHHGRAILHDAAGELEKARAILGDMAAVAEDGMRLEV